MITSRLATSWLVSYVNSSSINWTQAGQTLANGGLSRVSTNRKVTVVAGGGAGSRTHFVIDVVGYYL